METDRTLPVQSDGFGPLPTAESAAGDKAGRRYPSTAARLDGAPAELNWDSPGRTPRLTVVVPTRNEEGNVAPLLERLGPALVRLQAEIIVVDDSDDHTQAVLAVSAPTCPVPIRLLHRTPGSRSRGLSGAVIAGARQARGAWVLVMDADLQHPPESAAALASTAMRHDTDIVIGTRYAGRGSPGDGLGGAHRILVSRWATRLVKSFLPAAARHGERSAERAVRVPPRRHRPRLPQADRLQAPARDPGTAPFDPGRRGRLPLRATPGRGIQGIGPSKACSSCAIWPSLRWTRLSRNLRQQAVNRVRK